MVKNGNIMIESYLLQCYNVAVNILTEVFMVEIESLMNEKYFLLKHIYSRCICSKGEYLLEDTIDQMVIDTKIRKRTLCRLLKTLEAEGFISKSCNKSRKYQILKEKYELYNKLFTLIQDLK